MTADAPCPAGATPSAEAGEFTKMFQSAAAPPAAEPGLPAAPASAPAAPVRSAPARRRKRASLRGCSKVQLRRRRRSQACRLLPASAPVTPAAPAAGPGEFTRLFQAPPPPPGAAPPAPVKPAGPGEFTRMFDSPLPDVPAPGDWPAPAAKPHAPSEFTQMFQTPAPPSAGGFPRQEASSRSSFDRGPEARRRDRSSLRHPSFRKQRRRLPRLRGRPSPATTLACSVREG